MTITPHPLGAIPEGGRSWIMGVQSRDIVSPRTFLQGREMYRLSLDQTATVVMQNPGMLLRAVAHVC